MNNKWFGKGCDYLVAQWEENEITGGSNYREAEPVLKFCKHPANISDYEGNCNIERCPLVKKDKDNE